jgi:DNA-binding beta-propeller fold protein YncE
LHQARNVAVVAGVILASFFSITTAEEATPAVRVEADIAKSCYSARTGFGSLWMASGDELNRVDFHDNSVRRVPVKGLQAWHSSIAVGEGAVWLGDARATIYKVDPQTEQVTKEIRVDLDQSLTAFWNLATGEGSVWVTVGNRKLGRYSAASGAEEGTISLPSNSQRVLVAFGFVWVSGTENDELYRIDPATNQIVATIELRSRPRALAAGEGAIWAFNEGDGTVQRIDGKTGEQIATVETGTVGFADMTFGGGFIWIGTASRDLVQIDPRSNSVRGKFKPADGDYMAIGYGGASLWMCGSAAYRITPPG